MTRTSQALKRLGVAAIAVATIGAGVPALVASGASATNPTNSGITITPTTEAAQVNTCNPYTVQVTPADTTTVDIQISQTVATGTATIGFCNVTGAGAADGGANPTAGPDNHTTTTTDFAGILRANAGNQCAASNNTTVTCDGEFTTDNKGRLTFGVTSNTPGQMSVTAFVEKAAAPASSVAGNANGDNAPGTGEQQAVATKYLVADANAAVTSVACAPPSENAAVGTTVSYTCTAYTTRGSDTKVPVRGVTFYELFNSTSPDRSGNPVDDAIIKCGQPATSTSAVTADAPTNNQGTVTCSFTNQGQPGTDRIVNYIEQNTTAGPNFNDPNASVDKVFAGQERFIACTPKNPTVTYGVDQVITCKVTDLNGNPVPNADVQFTASFPGGRFGQTADYKYTTSTNASGVATATINNPDQTTQQTQTVTATLGVVANGQFFSSVNDTSAECNKAAGTSVYPAGQTGTSTPAAGNCSDTVTIKYTTAASPTATPTATTGPPPGCATAAGKNPNLQVRVNTPTINATGLASVTITGAVPGQVIELQGYSQNHYGTANFNNDPTPVDRTAVADSNGSATFNDLRPASNTRVRARQRGCAFGNIGAVVNVRAQETLQVTRRGVRTYTFSGQSIPARPGGLIISLYRIIGSPCAAGVEPRNCPGEVLIGQGRAGAGTDSGAQPAGAGHYSITKVFPLRDTNKRVNFVVKTGQDAQNAPGRSNARSLLIY